MECNAVQHVTMQCSGSGCAGCGNLGEDGTAKNQRACDHCNMHYGMAVRWLSRNSGWAMPLEWASAKACLAALGEVDRGNVGNYAVSELYSALSRAVPLFAGCNFSSFTRYMHGVLLYARDISGGFFLSGDWERARRCADLCGHVATADCSRRCNDVVREVSALRRRGGATALALAGGVLSVFAATRRAAKAEASGIVQDILSIDPVAYAYCEGRRMRDVYGIDSRLAGRVLDFRFENVVFYDLHAKSDISVSAFGQGAQ